MLDPILGWVPFNSRPVAMALVYEGQDTHVAFTEFSKHTFVPKE